MEVSGLKMHSIFDREIAQALAVLQVAVIGEEDLRTFVLIELYDAIDTI